MEKHITSADSFKAQVVKHQVASKTEFEAFGKKLTKSQQQLDATNRKFAEEMEKTRGIKDELKTKMDAIEERTTSTDVRLQELQTEFQVIKAKVEKFTIQHKVQPTLPQRIKAHPCNLFQNGFCANERETTSSFLVNRKQMMILP